MEVQNISGADVVSQRLSVETNISSENVRQENTAKSENQITSEENKGTLIDVKA
ncbi:MAG: hypothetical protein JW864_02280 [Spirochaetes bacterium]|nr:hypothetical protein [Spirochaetota bacterium]